MTKAEAQKEMTRLWFAVMIAGIVLRVAIIWRPADYRMLFPWRECDYTAIARSFYTEGMNILTPKVDWRGNTSGVVEMEFPVLPWIGALTYHAFGYHEVVLRFWSALCSVLSLFAFAALARGLLPAEGALVATAVFAVNGLLCALSGAIQPEPLQLLLTILAVHASLRWLRGGAAADLVKASVWTSMAILAKSPAALLGFVLAYAVVRRLGLRAFLRPLVYGCACIALVPPLLWYGWAHSQYLSTGLSLGLSNETHFLSWMMLTPQWLYWVRNMIIVEMRDVYMVFGLFLAGSALLTAWRKIELPVIWYVAALVFYVVSADTSGDPWAYHYHMNSIPPVSLLMGFGFVALGPDSVLASRRPSMARYIVYARSGILAVTLALLLARGVQLMWRTMDPPDLRGMYQCCTELKAHIPNGELIVVRGGTRVDEHDHPVAYNASMAFAWMDRKGFNYAQEDFGLESLRDISLKGGVYWIVQPEDRRDARFPSGAYSLLTPVAQCDSFVVYDLRPLCPEFEVRAR